MSEVIKVTELGFNVKVQEAVNKVVVASPGPQGVRGNSILSGIGDPAANLGYEGEFYFDKSTTRFYGPKLSSDTWVGTASFLLNKEYFLVYSWELAQVTGPVGGTYSVSINHKLGFYPNITVKTSSGDILETGIDYNSIDTLTLIMAQPFSGTAYLS
jgi:hypothetical protein